MFPIRQMARMEGKNPDSLQFHDARIDRTLYYEAKQLAADRYNNDRVRALYHMWDKFKEVGDTQNADITNNLLQKVSRLQEIEEEYQQQEKKQQQSKH